MKVNFLQFLQMFLILHPFFRFEPKGSQNWPKKVQNRAKKIDLSLFLHPFFRLEPKGSQNWPKKVQNGAKRAQSGAKRAPTGAQSSQRGAKREPKIDQKSTKMRVRAGTPKKVVLGGGEASKFWTHFWPFFGKKCVPKSIQKLVPKKRENPRKNVDEMSQNPSPKTCFFWRFPEKVVWSKSHSYLGKTEVFEDPAVRNFILFQSEPIKNNAKNIPQKGMQK